MSSTTLTYAGPAQIGSGSSFSPTATLASTASCQTGQPVSFSLSANPITGVAGSYALDAGTSASNGAVTGTPVSTTSWQRGVYVITASYAGAAQCAPATTTAALAVTSPGQFAFGGGRYVPVASLGSTSFGFGAWLAPHSTTTYQGQLDVVTAGKWSFQANVTSFGKTSSTQALLGGTGSLFWWNPTLNHNHGGWQLAASNVTYKATVNVTTKTAPGSFGITINYTPTAGQPSTLPNSAPVAFTKGGSIIF